MRTRSAIRADAPAVAEAVTQLELATSAKKCWPCGCLRETLAAIERDVPAADLPPSLAEATARAAARLVTTRYECLGCETCHPALVVNALNEAAGTTLVEPGSCSTEEAAERPGWPPLPGSYTVLRSHAPVAACTLTDAALAEAVARARPPGLAMAGTLLTENLGIERLIRNVIANPRIRFVVVAGADSPGRVGHLPGASLVALARNGIDGNGRIAGAPGRRPVLRNVSAEEISRFRSIIEVVDLIGRADPSTVLEAIASCAARDPGEASSVPSASVIPARIRGRAPERMTPDPRGWFVVDPDRRAGSLLLEHYTNAGVLDARIEAGDAASAYSTAIAHGLVTRLDHAAYLGKELARAEEALRTGDQYVQDAAPETSAASPADSGCGCESSGTQCGGPA